jgi:hypothetical protein
MGMKVKIPTSKAVFDFQALKLAWSKDVASLASVLREVIVDKLIQKGTSPVRGLGRCQDYSDSYLSQMGATREVTKGKNGKDKVRLSVDQDMNRGVIGTDGKRWEKKPRPVSLTVSGKMLSTFYVRDAQGKAKVGFSSPFATIHTEGMGKVPRRALLPTRSGEEFSAVVTRWLVERGRKVVDLVTGTG